MWPSSHDVLSGRGFDVFLDTHDIRPGNPFQEMLFQRLADSDVVIMLDTKIISGANGRPKRSVVPWLKGPTFCG